MDCLTGCLQNGQRSALKARLAHTLHTVWPHSSNAVSTSREQHIPHLRLDESRFFISSRALAILSTALFSSVFDDCALLRLLSYSAQRFLSVSIAAEKVCILLRYVNDWRACTTSCLSHHRPNTGMFVTPNNYESGRNAGATESRGPF